MLVNSQQIPIFIFIGTTPLFNQIFLKNYANIHLRPTYIYIESLNTIRSKMNNLQATEIDVDFRYLSWAEIIIYFLNLTEPIRFNFLCQQTKVTSTMHRKTRLIALMMVEIFKFEKAYTDLWDISYTRLINYVCHAYCTSKYRI